MSGETTVTVIGSLGGDPELRFTPSGAAVCNFSIGTNARTFDKQTNEWVDGPTTWYNCSAWQQLAENVAESLQKGMRVVVLGHLVNRPYETRDGGKGYSLDLNVQAIGPELRFATARVTRAARDGSTPAPQARQQQRHQGGDDPWASTPPQQGQQGGTAPAGDPWATPGGQSDEPPF